MKTFFPPGAKCTATFVYFDSSNSVNIGAGVPDDVGADLAPAVKDFA